MHNCPQISKARRALVSCISSFIPPSRPPTKVLVEHAGVWEEFRILIDSSSDMISKAVVSNS